MTTHYIDIRLLPDPEFSHAHLLGVLMSKLHRTLVQLQADNIGVSFPQHVATPKTMRNLGVLLRLHGIESALNELMMLDWLKGMRDHVEVSKLAQAPAGTSHRLVRRRQYKTNADRLRRRRMKRKGETAEQAAAVIPHTVERKPELPFVQLRSHSTSQQFCVFIEHGAMQPEAVAGSFNTYGLSQGGSIPWF